VTAAAKTTACTWLRDHGLLAQERGAGGVVSAQPSPEVAAHLATCHACTQLYAEIGKLRAQIADLPAPGPPSGWQRAVWARIEAKKEAKTRSRFITWIFAIGAPLAAAAAILIVVRSGRGPQPVTEPAGALVLAYHFESDPQRARTRGNVAVGDAIIFETKGAGLAQPVAELRVYRDDAGIVLRCGTEAPCERQGDRLRARFTIPAIGRYRAMIVTAAQALPAPAGVLDDDLAAIARTPGAKWQWAETIEIW
jgi:hypothetical protein